MGTKDFSKSLKKSLCKVPVRLNLGCGSGSGKSGSTLKKAGSGSKLGSI